MTTSIACMSLLSLSDVMEYTMLSNSFMKTVNIKALCTYIIIITHM